MVIRVKIFGCFINKNYTASVGYAINHNRRSFFYSPTLEKNERINAVLKTLNLE
jgi:hypothetical protein